MNIGVCPINDFELIIGTYFLDKIDIIIVAKSYYIFFFLN